ncbi:hypothetical protein RA24_03745 [Leisingera sp. ANG-M6]|nr:hypothetical protein RA24_03745 [Leisingera sp. ANG-M6]
MTPVQEYLAARRLREEEEAARIEAVKARGNVPAECGDRIPEAPARGAFRVFEPMDLYPAGEDGFEVKPAGFRGRMAMQMADSFDVMAAKAARHKKGSPFTASQISMGRHYRDLVERHACAGVKCSSVEALGSGGSGQGGEFMDAVLRDREEIERLRRRIGTGTAMAVRRIRPSKRGSRASITDRRLVDMVCLEDRTISDVLKAHGWSVKGGTVTDVRRALAEALERMGSGGYPLSKIVCHR